MTQNIGAGSQFSNTTGNAGIEREPGPASRRTLPGMFDSTLSHLNDILENVLAYDQSDSPAISMGNGTVRNNYSYARWMDCSRKGILPWLTH